MFEQTYDIWIQTTMKRHIKIINESILSIIVTRVVEYLLGMYKTMILMSMLILQSRYLQLQSGERHPKICTLSDYGKFVEKEGMSLVHCFFQLHNILYQLHRNLGYVQFYKTSKTFFSKLFSWNQILIINGRKI